MGTNVDKLIGTIARLRAPDGCPWDREQTHRTLARFLLEEVYEVLEAIHLADSQKLKEELGDLLLQVVLHAQLAADAQKFDIEDVAYAVNEKMIRRHPHVFGDTKLATADEVLAAWEDLKAQEAINEKKSALTGVPRTQPALMQALKISQKAVTVGFEWQDEAQIWHQLESELGEFRQAASQAYERKNNGEELSLLDLDLEMGDILFTVVNIARWHRLNPEESLLMAVEKFKQRFCKMEEMSDRPLKDLSVKEWNELWTKAKIASSVCRNG